MSRKRVSPEAQIIALFTGLSDEGKRMVRFALDAIVMNETPKSPAPAATKKSSSKRQPEKFIPNSVDGTDDASTGGAKCTAQVPGLDVECGEPADALVHDPKGGYASYHEFEAPRTNKAKSAVK